MTNQNRIPNPAPLFITLIIFILCLLFSLRSGAQSADTTAMPAVQQIPVTTTLTFYTDSVIFSLAIRQDTILKIMRGGNMYIMPRYFCPCALCTNWPGYRFLYNIYMPFYYPTDSTTGR